jgi:heme oxygenase
MPTLTEGSTADARFSVALRDGTSDAHRRAEGSAFARALVRGQVGREAYAAFVGQLHFVYGELEAAGEAMASDPVAGPFVFRSLLRGSALDHDLQYLLGDAWADRIEMLPATRRYCERLREVAFGWPGGFVAHHYTRYMGDLSGGQAIRRVVERTFGLRDGNGVQFYRFPDIGDTKSFKAAYRELLDRAPWDERERARIIDESSIAFQHNGELFSQLEGGLR